MEIVISLISYKFCFKHLSEYGSFNCTCNTFCAFTLVFKVSSERPYPWHVTFYLKDTNVLSIPWFTRAPTIGKFQSDKLAIRGFKKKNQEGHRPYRSPEYQRLYTDFLSEGPIFVYQQPHHSINENQPWYSKAVS